MREEVRFMMRAADRDKVTRAADREGVSLSHWARATLLAAAGAREIDGSAQSS